MGNPYTAAQSFIVCHEAWHVAFCAIAFDEEGCQGS